MADFTVDAYGLSDDTARDWLFGNPIRSQLQQSMSDIAQGAGLLAQNQNQREATGAAGALRTLNMVMEQAVATAKANSTLVTIGLAIFGGALLVKAMSGGKGKRR